MATKHEKLRAMLSSRQQAQLDMVMEALEKDPMVLEHHKEVKREKRIQSAEDATEPYLDSDEGVRNSQREQRERYERACAFAKEALRQANGTKAAEKG